MATEEGREACGREFDALHAAAQASEPQKKSGAEIAADFIARLFGPVSEQRVYLASLPNKEDGKGEPGERHVITRELPDIERFMRKWDRPKRALYFCVGTVQRDARRRAKDTIAEIILLHAEIDCKDVDLAPDEITRKLGELRLLPTIVIASGHGCHVYWLLREAILATPETIERVEAVLRQLCDHLGGDRACSEVSRLMRLPGSHNTKFGGWLDVTVIADRPNLRYEIDEIEEWLGEVAPLIRRNDEAPVEDNPWLAVATQFGIKPSIDVEQRLAAMRYGGGGDASVHQTQISVTAALLNRGHPLEEIVATVLAATRAAAGAHADSWNWRREEREVRRMCADWLTKHPEIKEREQIKDQPEEAAQATGTNDVISLAEERSSRQQKGKASRKSGSSGPNAAAIAIVEGVIEIVRKAGGDLLLTAGDLFLYSEGIWRVANGGDVQWLRCLIQQGSQALGEGAKLGVVNAAWKRLVEHPDLHRANIAWDRRDLVALVNGVLNLRTRKFADFSPEHYLRRKLAVRYEPDRACPVSLILWRRCSPIAKTHHRRKSWHCCKNFSAPVSVSVCSIANIAAP